MNPSSARTSYYCLTGDEGCTFIHPVSIADIRRHPLPDTLDMYYATQACYDAHCYGGSREWEMEETLERVEQVLRHVRSVDLHSHGHPGRNPRGMYRDAPRGMHDQRQRQRQGPSQGSTRTHRQTQWETPRGMHDQRQRQRQTPSYGPTRTQRQTQWETPRHSQRESQRQSQRQTHRQTQRPVVVEVEEFDDEHNYWRGTTAAEEDDIEVEEIID